MYIRTISSVSVLSKTIFVKNQTAVKGPLCPFRPVDARLGPLGLLGVLLGLRAFLQDLLSKMRVFKVCMGRRRVRWESPGPYKHTNVQHTNIQTKGVFLSPRAFLQDLSSKQRVFPILSGPKTRTMGIPRTIKAYKHLSIPTYKHTCKHANTTYIYTGKNSNIQTHRQTFIHTNRNAYINTYIHTYKQLHKHTNKNTYQM